MVVERVRHVQHEVHGQATADRYVDRLHHVDFPPQESHLRENHCDHYQQEGEGQARQPPVQRRREEDQPGDSEAHAQALERRRREIAAQNHLAVAVGGLDPASQARRILCGLQGSLVVAVELPHSRVRVPCADPRERRLKLVGGVIHAPIVFLAEERIPFVLIDLFSPLLEAMLLRAARVDPRICGRVESVAFGERERVTFRDAPLLEVAKPIDFLRLAHFFFEIKF